MENNRRTLNWKSITLSKEEAKEKQMFKASFKNVANFLKKD